MQKQRSKAGVEVYLHPRHPKPWELVEPEVSRAVVKESYAPLTKLNDHWLVDVRDKLASASRSDPFVSTTRIELLEDSASSASSAYSS